MNAGGNVWGCSALRANDWRLVVACMMDTVDRFQSVSTFRCLLRSLRGRARLENTLTWNLNDFPFL